LSGSGTRWTLDDRHAIGIAASSVSSLYRRGGKVLRVPKRCRPRSGGGASGIVPCGPDNSVARSPEPLRATESAPKPKLERNPYFLDGRVDPCTAARSLGPNGGYFVPCLVYLFATRRATVPFSSTRHPAVCPFISSLPELSPRCLLQRLPALLPYADWACTP
jgi:hypothetical protein